MLGEALRDVSRAVGEFDFEGALETLGQVADGMVTGAGRLSG